MAQQYSWPLLSEVETREGLGRGRKRFAQPLGPLPRATVGVENMRNGFHTGVTSHLCKAQSPQPGPRVHPSRSLSDELCSASESFASAS